MIFDDPLEAAHGVVFEGRGEIIETDAHGHEKGDKRDDDHVGQNGFPDSVFPARVILIVFCHHIPDVLVDDPKICLCFDIFEQY
jgi:hypothetical protein